MAIMWNGSIIPWIDPTGAPRSGAKAFFFKAGTTTPRTVYRDSGLGESHDHPVVANASGMFPAVFLSPGNFRLRITDANGVTLSDVDSISAPIFQDPGSSGGGDTPVTLLARTGDYKFRHDTGSHSGWVRANGRTIGNAESGATERASADCEDLFIHLWTVDSTLTVSGGRGANAASDWAASRTIALPDLRLRTLIGMAAMGNSTSTLIGASEFEGSESGNNLGARAGAGRVTLTTDQLPPHKHSGTTDSDGNHNHNYQDLRVTSGTSPGGIEAGSGRSLPTNTTRTTDSAGSHNHSFDTGNTGGGESHSNVQPSMAATAYIKL